MGCQESWGASRQWEPLAEAALSHKYIIHIGNEESALTYSCPVPTSTILSQSTPHTSPTVVIHLSLLVEVSLFTYLSLSVFGSQVRGGPPTASIVDVTTHHSQVASPRPFLIYLWKRKGEGGGIDSQTRWKLSTTSTAVDRSKAQCEGHQVGASVTQTKPEVQK